MRLRQCQSPEEAWEFFPPAARTADLMRLLQAMTWPAVIFEKEEQKDAMGQGPIISPVIPFPDAD